MEAFRWCFIGTGTLAKIVAKQLLATGRHRIVSCYTRNYEKALSFASSFQAKAFESAEEAISAEGVDGVYIVTPHNAHFRFAKKALLLGKPVFLEKPFTVTAEETKELIELAKEKNVYLAEAMWTWFSPVAHKVKEWIDEKKCGKILSADFTYHLNSIRYAPRVADPKRAGGALLDITIYPITYAYRLWGKPSRIEAKARLENGIDLSEEILFHYEEGFSVSVSGSIVDFKGLEKMKIRGEEGTISSYFYHCQNKVGFRKDRFHKESFHGKGGMFLSYVEEFDAVAQDIREGRKESSLVPLEATYEVMLLLDEIRKLIGLEYENLE